MQAQDYGHFSLERDQKEIISDQRVDQAIFLVLQIVGGHVLLPLLLITATFSKKCHRHLVFLVFCSSWILSSIVYSLIVYHDRSTDRPSLNPSPDLCLVQASLIYGVQAWTSCTTLALVAHLYKNIRLGTGQSTKPIWLGYFSLENVLGIFSPILVLLVFSLAAFLVGSEPGLSSDGSPLRRKNNSLPTTYYCIIRKRTNLPILPSYVFKFHFVVLAFVLVLSLITLCCEVLCAIEIYKQTRKEGTIGKSFTSTWSIVLLRLIVFSVYRTVALMAPISIFMKKHSGWNLIKFTRVSQVSSYSGSLELISASIPLLIFFVFASERDVGSTWLELICMVWNTLSTFARLFKLRYLTYRESTAFTTI